MKSYLHTKVSPKFIITKHGVGSVFRSGTNTTRTWSVDSWVLKTLPMRTALLKRKVARYGWTVFNALAMKLRLFCVSKMGGKITDAQTVKLPEWYAAFRKVWITLYLPYYSGFMLIFLKFCRKRQYLKVINASFAECF